MASIVGPGIFAFRAIPLCPRAQNIGGGIIGQVGNFQNLAKSGGGVKRGKFTVFYSNESKVRASKR